MDNEIANKQIEFLKEQIESEERCLKVARSLELNYTIQRIMREKVREMRFALDFITDRYRN